MGKRIYKKMFACQVQSIQRRRPNALQVPALVLLVCGLSMLNACKTYYKRGGDGGALAGDQAECQRRSGDAAGEHYQACLRELGWVTSEGLSIGADGDPHDLTMRSFGVLRADQDAFALRSQQRAEAAMTSGVFADEITPVRVPQRKGDPMVVDTDEHPRETSLEKLAQLKPLFPGGTVTAGNASGINDGAAALLLAEAALRALRPPAASIMASYSRQKSSTSASGTSLGGMCWFSRGTLTCLKKCSCIQQR